MLHAYIYTFSSCQLERVLQAYGEVQAYVLVVTLGFTSLPELLQFIRHMRGIMRRVRNFWSAVALIAMLCFATVAHGAALDAGTAWLEAAQDASGSWGNTPSALTDEHMATALSVEALASAGMSNSAAVADASIWLASQSLESTAHLALRYLAMGGLGLDASVYNATADLDMIHAALNADGGWGGYLHYGSSPLHTALAAGDSHEGARKREHHACADVPAHRAEC